MIELLLALSLTAIIAVNLRYYLKIRSRTADLRAKFMRRFFEIAQELVTNEALPEAAEERIERFARMMNDPKCYDMVAHALRDDSSNGSGNGIIDKLTPEIRRQYSNLIVFWVLAATTHNPIRGTLLRDRFLTFLEGRDDKDANRLTRRVSRELEHCYA